MFKCSTISVHFFSVYIQCPGIPLHTRYKCIHASVYCVLDVGEHHQRIVYAFSRSHCICSMLTESTYNMICRCSLVTCAMVVHIVSICLPIYHLRTHTHSHMPRTHAHTHPLTCQPAWNETMVHCNCTI